MITSPGIGSGLDIESLVVQLVTLEGQAPADRLALREAGFQAELSALGTFRSALDSMRSALAPLKDLSQFGSRIASSSNEEVFTVSADTDMVPGTYAIEVVSLAQVNKLSSAAYVDGGTYVGTGTLDITIDGTSLSIDMLDTDAATLADIRNAINNADNNPGVVASIINAQDGAHLILTGTKTGNDNVIELTVTGGDGGLADLVANLTEQQAAADAEITIDSFTHFSSTNTVTDAFEGLTIELQGAEPGTAATLTVELDVSKARNLVEDFVDSYNALVNTTSSLTRYNPETKEAGLLQGRSIVSSLMTRLYAEFNDTVSGPLTSLRDLGMSVSVDGKIELDDAKLDEVLSSSFSQVGDLFAARTGGVAVRFDTLLDDYLKFNGLLDVRSDGLETSIKQVNDNREQLDRHLAAVEKRLRSQFLALDSLISQLNGTSSFLGAQLSNLVSPTALLGRGR